MKALSLFSGGLDSQLAVCLIKEQGIEVIGVNFSSPFFGADSKTILASEDLGIELKTINIGDEYMDVLKNPHYGYGKNLNPCIDCHAFMERKAGEYMKEIGASFIITGEVLGQRPMSQNKSSLNAVDKLSGMKGLILRPLSAKLFPLSIPEEKGWIDREKLLDISGRSRTIQMQMAEYYGIKDYPTPAGGCLLTQENYSNRLQKYLDFKPEAKAKELEILKYGRHFYLNNNTLLMVGRNRSENDRLSDLSLKNDLLIRVSNRPGPLGILRIVNNVLQEDKITSAAIVARYSDAKNDDQANVKVYAKNSNDEEILILKPMKAENVPLSV